MKSVDIFGARFKIVKKRGFSSKTGYAALFCPDSKTITVDASLKGDYLAATLLHEILHAVFFRVGLCQAKISVDAQEIMVENNSTWLVENKHLVKKILFGS